MAGRGPAADQRLTDLRRTRIGIGIFGTSAVLVVAGSTFVAWVWTILTCGGDGGYPYSARDSATGEVCQELDDNALVLLAQLGVPLLTTVLVLGLAVRWARWWLAWTALAAGLALSLAPAFIIESLPDSCSESEQEAFNAWAEGGGRGPLPADCETY